MIETRLDKLLESIDPAVTLDQVSTPIDEALNSFNMASGMIQRWDEFKGVLTRFSWHVQSEVLRIRLSRSPDPDMDWGRCCELLLKEYGVNGEKAAFEIARTGMEGGLYQVLKALATRMIEEYASREISAKISHFWHGLSPEEQLASAEEYLQKYGHLLPSELTEGSAARIKAEFIKVLEEHPRMINRLRGIARGS
jgi:hypothetical protein